MSTSKASPSAVATRTGPGQVLIAGIVGNRVVVAPQSVLFEHADLRAALRDSSTWGEFKAAVAPKLFQAALARASFDDEDDIGDDDGDGDGGDEIAVEDRAFDVEQIEGYSDGDWQPLLEARMAKWLPPDVLKRFARPAQSALRQEWLEIAAADFAALIAALEAEGIEVEVDHGLIERATGMEG